MGAFKDLAIVKENSKRRTKMRKNIGSALNQATGWREIHDLYCPDLMIATRSDFDAIAAFESIPEAVEDAANSNGESHEYALENIVEIYPCAKKADKSREAR